MKWTRIEDVFPIETGDIPASYVSLPEANGMFVKIRQSQKETHLPNIIFQGRAVKFRGCHMFWESCCLIYHRWFFGIFSEVWIHHPSVIVNPPNGPVALHPLVVTWYEEKSFWKQRWWGRKRTSWSQIYVCFGEDFHIWGNVHAWSWWKVVWGCIHVGKKDVDWMDSAGKCLFIGLPPAC